VKQARALARLIRDMSKRALYRGGAAKNGMSAAPRPVMLHGACPVMLQGGAGSGGVRGSVGHVALSASIFLAALAKRAPLPERALQRGT
jgi:hypothetical protein